MIKSFEENKKTSISITLLIAIVIFLFSSIPGNSRELIPGINILSITYHFSIFFFLNFFLLISLHGKNKINNDYILLGAIISIFYGILDEVHQLFVPLRFSGLGDVMTDTAGILVASMIYIYIKKKN